jgi:hypothetical protein
VFNSVVFGFVQVDHCVIAIVMAFRMNREFFFLRSTGWVVTRGCIVDCFNLRLWGLG